MSTTSMPSAQNSHYSRAGRVAFGALESSLRFLCRYHRYTAVGFEQLPTTGPFLIVSNHSLATYDAFLIGVRIYDELQRMPRPILDRHLLGLPVFGEAMREIGFLDGDRDGVIQALKDGSIVAVIPGGMRESLRPSTRKHEVDWTGRTGFIRVSILSGAPIVLAACPAGDNIYDVSESRVTTFVYDRFRLPLPIFRGVGPTVLPKPVKLTCYLSEPFFPPVPPDQVTDDAVRDHQVFLAEKMNRLLQDHANE